MDYQSISSNHFCLSVDVRGSALSPGAVAGIVFGVILLVSAVVTFVAVIYYRHHKTHTAAEVPQNVSITYHHIIFDCTEI